MASTRIEYQHDDTLLEGYLSTPNGDGPFPTVLIAHDWSGRNDFACSKADALADLGFNGFALDMYGKGRLGTNNDEKAALMTPLMENRQLLQNRMLAALEVIQQQEKVDTSRIAVIGFCFGGLCALDLARTGANIQGVVSFHGLLQAPETQTMKIKAKVLALHGYNDPMVEPAQVEAFASEMTEAEADWQVHLYGNTVHAFTNPEANDKSFGTVYNKKADERSWHSMQLFLNEIFA